MQRDRRTISPARVQRRGQRRGIVYDEQIAAAQQRGKFREDVVFERPAARIAREEAHAISRDPAQFRRPARLERGGHDEFEFRGGHERSRTSRKSGNATRANVARSLATTRNNARATSAGAGME